MTGKSYVQMLFKNSVEMKSIIHLYKEKTEWTVLENKQAR